MNDKMIGSHARKLLEAVGEPCGPLEGPLLRDFNWKDYGIGHPYLIFMTGRCGSTWLTSILKSTRLVGTPGEFFNATVAQRESRGTTGLREYFISVVKREAGHGRFGAEIDSERLQHIENLFDWPSVFPKDLTNTFFLYRRNLAAQAWSWASARKSGLWHVRSGTNIPQPSVSKELPSDGELIREMVRIRRDEEFLQRFFNTQGYEPYYLDYESLVAELSVEIGTILRMLSIDKNEVSKVLKVRDEKVAVSKIQYTEKDGALSEFCRKHQRAIGALRKNRFGISAEELTEILAD